jgi:hypothetical protein
LHSLSLGRFLRHDILSEVGLIVLEQVLVGIVLFFGLDDDAHVILILESVVTQVELMDYH